MNIKQTAHNWARKYMKNIDKQTRFSLMDEAERKLFLYVRERNINMIGRLIK